MGVDSFDGLGAGWQKFSHPEDMEDWLGENAERDFRIIYTPTAGNKMLHFEAVNIIVKSYGHMVYAVDEIDLFMNAGAMPPEMYDLVNYSRHARVAMIGTARNTVQVARQYTSMLTEACIFCMTEPRYVKYFEDLCGREVSDQLPTLTDYAYVRWMGTGEHITSKGWGNGKG